jgi:hypothetical protein
MKPVRNELLDFLREDLLGPSKADEVLSDPPSSVYVVGVLYPGGAKPADEVDDTLGLGADEEGDDGVNAAADIRRIQLPGSLGLTFSVTEDIKSLEVRFSAARYAEFRQDEQRVWHRLPLQGVETVPLEVGSRRYDIAEKVSLDVITRHLDGALVVSVFLTNREQEPESGRNDTLCLYQPELQISAGGAAAFLDRRREADIATLSDEERSTRLLYLAMPEFARGHNCAADWDAEEGKQATTVRSVIMPSWEVHPILPKDSDAEEAIAEIEPLLAEYEAWIREQREQLLPRVQEPLKDTARNHLRACEYALRRMREGLSCLRDTEVGDAFRFACRVMLLQRGHSLWSLARRRGDSEAELKLEGRWRPFQLAFLLMNLPVTVNPEHEDRDLVDLLWFPTGGGKTEAYLGVAAFTLGLRRLRKDGGDGAGVTVIMRYTLRLLTLQQFQRATALICACEVVRREAPERWGDEPFRIGLWVGTKATPKNINGAERALADYRRGRIPSTANPVQFTSCPWCGEALTWQHYSINKRANRMLVTCPRPVCEFHANRSNVDSGLPVVLTDEEIYATRPTLLIGTVDKFAQLPWVDDTLRLFGRGRNPTAPPALILVDELHLISGPLGTITGLYETVIDVLSTSKAGIRPRYVASTATIRHADEQCRGLFTRRVAQFPPPGLDARDSWFARERHDLSGRMYVGINPVGKSGKTALLRVYAALLHRTWTLRNKGSSVDPWWTLVGYFNAIRELAGAIPLCEDDVNERLRALAKAENYGKERRIIYSDRIQELTSRLASTEVPEALMALERTIDGKTAPMDIVLASKMISVGVDIDRLGTMVVAGQPKDTSEYIQATSRVGRRHPGLVCTLYRWTRPRDISHYEHFRGYHQSLYQHVEATSVTPFAPQARSRGLHALLIALIRHLDGGLPAGGDAARISNVSDDLIQQVLEILRRRAHYVGEDGQEVVEEAEARLDEWRQIARVQRDLRYGSMGGPANGRKSSPSLMEPAPGKDEAWPTLTSLREVEPSAEFYFYTAGAEPEL